MRRVGTALSTNLPQNHSEASSLCIEAPARINNPDTASQRSFKRRRGIKPSARMKFYDRHLRFPRIDNRLNLRYIGKDVAAFFFGITDEFLTELF